MHSTVLRPQKPPSLFSLRPQKLPDEDCVYCPHCDAVLEDEDTSWYDDKSSYEDEVKTCPVCERKFTLTVQYVMYVSARKQE